MTDSDGENHPMTDTETLYQAAVSFQAMNAAREARHSKMLRRGLVISVGLNVLLGVAVVSIMPLKTYLPAISFINEAGIRDQVSAYSDLPPSQQVAGIEADLWTYLKDREGFSPSEADTSYEVISAMSSNDVRRQYQGDANVKFNPHAPAKVLGPNGAIRITRKAANWVTHSDDYAAGTYRIEFCRTVVRQDVPPVSQRMEETFSYQTAERVPLLQRVTFNPFGLVITDYPTAREEGAFGAAHPCD